MLISLSFSDVINLSVPRQFHIACTPCPEKRSQ